MISVVIPTFNEAEELPGCLAALRDQAAHELIVADGGSTDGTAELAATAGAVLVECGVRQRAAQMNLGARRASGDILLFLHADTRLPAGGLAAVEEAVAGGRGRRLLPPAAAGRVARPGGPGAARRPPLPRDAHHHRRPRHLRAAHRLSSPSAASRCRRSWKTWSSAGG